MISLRGVCVSRDGRTAINELTLDLTERRTGVIGANGSGKSTFSRLLNGLVLPTKGSVLVSGHDTARDVKAVRRLVGFVFQNPDNQIVYPTVAEDVAFGLKRRGLSKEEIVRQVDVALERHGLGGFGPRLIHELSGGERQLVALAGVMVMQPSILVLDEPTTLLDRRNTRRFMEAVGGFAGHVVMVTHDLALLDGFDRVLLFDEGRLRADASPAIAVAEYLRLCG